MSASPRFCASFRASRRGRMRGFTLVEVMTVCVIVAILAAVAFPAANAHLRRGKRQDAISALTRLQQAQDNYQYQNGLYAPQLQLLGLPAASMQGLYAVEISAAGPASYSATATARAGSSQTKDGECSTLRLTVTAAGPEYGPTASCWNR